MKRPFELELITTTDGSHTLKLKGHDEQYHSVNGAYTESMHVFIHTGFDAVQTEEDIRVLEVGMGTGLNAWLTAQKTLSLKKNVYYHAIEPFPLEKEILAQLNYDQLYQEEGMHQVFRQIHAAPPESIIAIGDTFHFKLSVQSIQEIILTECHYHVVYFDAFGPDTQGELWRQEIFEKLYRCLKPGGILVTYCAKGAVKRALKASGFQVENLPGPPGKREITRAVKM
jgi:tRNA U34 5-methylaminomethyl-2-thiouridine-forming methyltransferase MnmC